MRTLSRLSPLLTLLFACHPTRDSGSLDAADADADTDADTDTESDADLPPSAPGVSISPAAPSGTLDLLAQVDTPSVDPESQSVHYRYDWSVDGAARADLTEATVPAAELFEGAVWSVVVTPSASGQDGPAADASAEVHNDAPTVTGHLEPEAPNPGDTLDLVFDSPAADPNGDALTTSIKWYKNDAYHLDWDGLTEIVSTQVRGGDRFRVVFSTSDGLLTSDVQTDEVTVTNTPPVITTATITPDTAKDADDLVVGVHATDADGNTLTYSYTWHRNAVEATDVGDTDTVPASATEVDDVWYCTVTVSDGSASVSQDTASRTIIPWEGTHAIYTFNATIPSGAATSTGSWAIRYLSHGARDGENDCDLDWTFGGLENATLCRGCDFRFDTTLSYDAGASTVRSGCASATVDATGDWTYASDGTRFYTYMYGPSFSSTYSRGLSFSAVSSGGYRSTYYGTTSYRYYSVTSSEDSAGNTELTAYWNEGRLTY